MSEINKGSQKQLDIQSSHLQDFNLRYYKVGNNKIQDQWLSNHNELVYRHLINKSFELLNGLACLQYLRERDGDNIIKIEKIQKEIEYINNNNDAEIEINKLEKQEKVYQELLYNTEQEIPFHKKSKILGKPIVRQCRVENEFIRIIYHSKKDKQILHNKYTYQIEKIEFDSMIQIQQQSKKLQNQVKYRIKVIKQFFYQAMSPINSEPVPSQLKWIDNIYNYRIVIKNPTEYSFKFEYALYFKNFSDIYLNCYTLLRYQQKKVIIDLICLLQILINIQINKMGFTIFISFPENYQDHNQNILGANNYCDYYSINNQLYLLQISSSINILLLQKVQKVRDLINVSRALFTQDVSILNCKGNFKMLFEKISTKWKSHICSLVKKQLEKYSATYKQIHPAGGSTQHNQQSFTLNTSFSQDYYINRNSKPLQFRNNFSLQENQLPFILNDLQAFKDRSSINGEELYQFNDDERIIKGLIGSNQQEKVQEEYIKQITPFQKKESMMDDFDTNNILMPPQQKEKIGKSDAFENFLRSNTKSMNNQNIDQSYGLSDKIKLRDNNGIEDDGLPQPIQKQNDINNLSDESLNFENLIEQKKVQFEQQEEMKYINNENEEKLLLGKNSTTLQQNPNNVNSTNKNPQFKSVNFQEYDIYPSTRSNFQDNQSYEVNYNILMQDSDREQTPKINQLGSKVQTVTSSSISQHSQQYQPSSITVSQQESSVRGSIAAPPNSIYNPQSSNRTNISNEKNVLMSNQLFNSTDPRDVEKPKEAATDQYKTLINAYQTEQVQSDQDQSRYKQPSIANQLGNDSAQQVLLDPLQEEPEITSIGSITPQNSNQRLQSYTFNQSSKNQTKFQHDSVQSQNNKSQNPQLSQQQVQHLLQSQQKAQEDQQSKINHLGSNRSIKNPVSILDYLDQQQQLKQNSQRSISVSSTGQKPQLQQQNDSQNNANQPYPKQQIEIYPITTNEIQQVASKIQNIQDNLGQYQKEQKYQIESAILENYKRKSLLGKEENQNPPQVQIEKLQEDADQPFSIEKNSQESSKHELQIGFISNRILNQQSRKKDSMLDYITMNRENLMQSNNSPQNINNTDANISIFLQRIELISPTTQFPPEIQLEMYLFNVNSQQIQSQNEWKDFIKPVMKSEDNFIYEVEEDFKQKITSLNHFDTYELHIIIKTKFNSSIIGNIGIKLTDILDFDNPGKDFWLICPVVYPNIPFALVNMWTSLHENCENYKDHIFQIYSQINTIKHPIYQSHTHFPELRIEDLNKIEQLIAKMGYKQHWLQDDIFEEQNAKLLNGSKLKEIKRQLQFGMMNRIGYFSANIFIQENIYNRLLVKLKERSLPKNEIVNHFHSLCLEGIPYTKRQELYLELLDLKDKIEKVREDFLSYCSCNPANQNTNYTHSISDIYVSYELNQSGKEVRTLLNDFNFTTQRDNFYQVLYSEAKYYNILFDIDYSYEFCEDQQMAHRILRTFSFVMTIQSMSIAPQFYSIYHQILNKCLILNNIDKSSQESEAFWLLYCIITTFNSNRSLLTRYLHLIESSTNFQKLTNFLGMDCLVGLFSSSFNDELCFRCWDVIFMEEKRKSWDMLGFLSCIGISLCNQYQIKSQKEWEVLGKYYFNFSELNRITKDTYETLLGDQNNYKKWIEKQTLAEQVRQRSIKKYENQRLIVSKYIHNFNININFQELEKLVNDLLQYNYYQSKYQPAQIKKQKQASKQSEQNPSFQIRNQTERNLKSPQPSPANIANSQYAQNNSNLQSIQLKAQNLYSTPNQKIQNNFLSIQKNNLITLSADVNGEGPSIPQLQQGIYNSASSNYSLQLRGQGQSNIQFANILTPQKGKQSSVSIRQFSPVTSGFQNALSKKNINPYRTNSTESNRSPQSNRDPILNYASKLSSRKSDQWLYQTNNFSSISPKEELNYYVDGTNKYCDGVLEALRQNSFQDHDEEYVFKKENLHIFISKLICRDVNYSYQEGEEFEAEKEFEDQSSSNEKGLKDLLNQVRSQAGVKKLKSIYNPLNKLQLQNISYWLEVGGREVKGDDCEKIDKYQFFESVEHTPILRIRAMISDMIYFTDIDLRAFNRNTMYHQIAFMQEDSYPDQIIVEFNVYIENFSLYENFSLQPVLQQQVIQQYISKKQKQNESTNNIIQSLCGVYDISQLRNDVCINNSFTNSPIERFKEFEIYYNNQVLLQSNISHFIYSKNILTRNKRVFKLQTLNPQNIITPNLLLEQRLLSLVEPTRVSSFKNLIKELNENDAIEIIQFLLFYVPVSYEQKLKILYKLFLLHYPQQTSDDLESYLMDFCLKTEISFYQFRDLQQSFLEQSTSSFQVTQARILFDSGSVYDVSQYFTNQIVNKICNSYLLHSINISQPFIIEKILQYIRSNVENSPSKQENELSAKTQQRPTKKIVDYNINLNSHEQNKLNMKNQTPFDPIQTIPFDSKSSQNNRKNFFFDQESDIYTFENNPNQEKLPKQQDGRFEVYFKHEGKVVKKEVDFIVDEFNKVSITNNYDSSVKLKELFSKNQLVIRNKAICYPLTQFRNWINLKKYTYVGDFEAFKSHINGLQLLEVYLMKNSQFVHPSQPIQPTTPFILQVNYHETKQLYCDYIFVSSNLHKQLTKSLQINYLPHLTLDDSILQILSRLLKQTPHYIKKNIQVIVNQQVITQFNIPLKEVVTQSSLEDNNYIVSIIIKDRKQSSRNSSKQSSPHKNDQLNSKQAQPKYSFNGYSVWNICSNKQYLPCKIVQPSVIKYNNQKIYYDSSEDVIKWY